MNTSMSEASALRLRAETQLQMNVSETGFSCNVDETQQLHHELQVHQTELEMQNSELRQSRNELENSLEKSTDLYEFAPVGYCTLNRSGTITAMNLRGAALLGVERSGIIGLRFGQFVMKEHRFAFAAFLDALYTSLGKIRQKNPKVAMHGSCREIDTRCWRIRHAVTMQVNPDCQQLDAVQMRSESENWWTHR